MLNYSSIRKISVNNKPYYVHTDVLKKMPFFDDFIKNNDEEINITLDNVDDKTVTELFKSLYKSLVNTREINDYEAFKLFLLGDYFCIDLYSYGNDNPNKKELVNYAIENNQIEKLAIFSKKVQIEYNLFEHQNIDFETMNKLKDLYRIREINYVWTTKCLDIVFEIFNTKKIQLYKIDVNDEYYEDSILFHCIFGKKNFCIILHATVNDALVDFCGIISDFLDCDDDTIYKKISSLRPCKIKEEFMESSLYEIKKRIINDILIKGKLCKYYYFYKTAEHTDNERYAVCKLKKIYGVEKVENNTI